MRMRNHYQLPSQVSQKHDDGNAAADHNDVYFSLLKSTSVGVERQSEPAALRPALLAIIVITLVQVTQFPVRHFASCGFAARTNLWA